MRAFGTVYVFDSRRRVAYLQWQLDGLHALVPRMTLLKTGIKDLLPGTVVEFEYSLVGERAIVDTFNVVSKPRGLAARALEQGRRFAEAVGQGEEGPHGS